MAKKIIKKIQVNEFMIKKRKCEKKKDHSLNLIIEIKSKFAKNLVIYQKKKSNRLKLEEEN